MSATAFNRARRQAEALAAAGGSGKSNPLSKLSPEETSTYPDGYNLGPAEPPYPDVRKMTDVPSEYDLNREIEAAKEAELNKVRILSKEAQEDLQNAHLRKTNAGFGTDFEREAEFTKKAEKNRSVAGSGEAKNRLTNTHLLDADVQPERPGDGFVPVKYESQKEESKLAAKGAQIIPGAETFAANEEVVKARKERGLDVKATPEEAAKVPDQPVSVDKPKPAEPPKPEKPVQTPKAATPAEINKEFATKPSDAPKSATAPLPGTAPAKDKP
jgi:hypothetical protein